VLLCDDDNNNGAANEEEEEAEPEENLVVLLALKSLGFEEINREEAERRIGLCSVRFLLPCFLLPLCV
jgi:Holliday junction resolvasome RuvABC DNA-binding subunit